MKHTNHALHLIAFVILIIVFIPGAIIYPFFWLNCAINNRSHNKREAARVKKNDGLNEKMLNELKLLRQAQGAK